MSDEAINLHTELQATLALAAGLATRFFEHIEPGRDQPRLALALYAEYQAATDKTFRRFMDPRERRVRKLQPRRSVRTGLVSKADLP